MQSIAVSRQGITDVRAPLWSKFSPTRDLSSSELRGG